MSFSFPFQTNHTVKEMHQWCVNQAPPTLWSLVMCPLKSKRLQKQKLLSQVSVCKTIPYFLLTWRQVSYLLVDIIEINVPCLKVTLLSEGS